MDTLRPILWLALAFVLFLLWGRWQDAHRPQPIPFEPSVEAPRDTAPSAMLPSASTVATVAPAAASSASTAAAPAAMPPPAAGISEPAPASAPVGERIRIANDVLELELDTLGGDLVAATLLDYPVHKGEPALVSLLEPSGMARAVVRAGIRSGDGQVLDRNTLWQLEPGPRDISGGQDELTVVLRAQVREGVVAEKTYTLRRGDYAIGLTQRVMAEEGTTWRGDAFVQIDEHVVPIERSFFSTDGYSFYGIAYHDGEKYQKLDADKLAEGPFQRGISGGWIANLRHHFLVAMVPGEEGENVYFARDAGQRDYAAGYVQPGRAVPGGQAVEFKSTLWVGPKLQDRLVDVAPGLELATDYGMFTIFAKPLFWALEKLHWLFGNWGWSIIGLTVGLKLAFYKLAETSGRSMAKMRTVAPKLEELKRRYKDDKQKLNEKMLELYRDEKINPVAGCLPVLIQLPVFIALYWVLLESVEMRQAPWALWIDDLSARDPFFVLPLLMGAAMWVQMKLNPPPPDPVQAKVMQFMPIMFTGMSAFFPAGLTLYWLVNTALSVAQQWRINQVVEREASARKR